MARSIHISEWYVEPSNFDFIINDLLIEKWIGTVIQMHYSPRGLRPNNRWWRAFVNEREGISCPIGSIRNVFCPMCQNEIHAWYVFLQNHFCSDSDIDHSFVRNSVLQMPYGTYTANVDGSSLVLGTSARFRYNTVDDNVNFFNQPTEIAPTRVFVATTTIPSLSSLSQGTLPTLSDSF